MAPKITVEQITEKLEKHVEDMFTSEGFKRWLKTLSAFPTYSLNNTLLINMQMPGATKVCGYNKWQELGRQVKLGQGVQGIRIYVPIKKHRWVDEKDDKGNPVLDDNGKPKKIKREWIEFGLGSVFDISQTEGDPLPDDPCKALEDEADYDFLITLVEASPVPVSYKKLDSGYGYFDKKGQQIVLNKEMSEAQMVKTLLSEMAEAVISEDSEETDSCTLDLQAEAVAYTVSQYYDFDTSDYSFGYIASWAKGKGKDELKESMEPIRKTSKLLIDRIDKKIAAI